MTFSIILLVLWGIITVYWGYQMFRQAFEPLPSLWFIVCILSINNTLTSERVRILQEQILTMVGLQ